jgi:hypothetical protein
MKPRNDDIETDYEVLAEARRNPEQNPKYSSYELLKPYSKDEDIYISFTSVNKIGVNPQSGHNTPIGVYTYPLSVIWDEYEINRKAHDIRKAGYDDKLTAFSINRLMGRSVPFAGESSYIQVIKKKPTKKFIDVSIYSSKNYDDDMEKIIEMITPGNRDYAKELIQRYTYDSAYRSPGGSMWNVLRKMTQNHQNLFIDPLPSKPPVAWTALFRRLGWLGFEDKMGKGIIHSSEPFQAVFLSSKIYRHVDTVLNDRRIKSKSKTPAWLRQARKKDAKFSVIGGVVVWEGGSLIDIDWEGGTWKDGTFVNGNWMRGIWKGGTFVDSVWHDGIWEDGLWKGINFVEGTWKGGTWESGTFTSGTWEDGLWLDGVWRDGVWEGGIWRRGKIETRQIADQRNYYFEVESKYDPNTFYEIEAEVVEKFPGIFPMTTAEIKENKKIQADELRRRVSP